MLRINRVPTPRFGAREKATRAPNRRLVKRKPLAYIGFAVSVVDAKAVDIKTFRERLALTQEQFALIFGLELDAVRNWEHGRRAPDAAARSYLLTIEKRPEAVRDSLSVPVCA